MYATDRRQTKEKHRLMPPPNGVGGITTLQKVNQRACNCRVRSVTDCPREERLVSASIHLPDGVQLGPSRVYSGAFYSSRTHGRRADAATRPPGPEFH